ncbi:restriction endonuclease [Archangium lansingense]|uniref:Restriction endonuclease type IV Mrr domain-containing protein n=1 Tax=Archangium lansingense TaxID=2995310 RepID=A0ABT4A2C1_9BACT|nr:hypothetical protein [Archangium lansinium]MCY1075795.1 hypothetical protein [Archangium lansinium]
MSKLTSTDFTADAKALNRVSSVRYIKLGKAGGWEAECLKLGIVRYGFNSRASKMIALSKSGKWSELTQAFLAAGLEKGVATRFTNESRHFFEDDGSTLWITFMGQTLYWGFVTREPPFLHEDGNGVWRRLRGGWKCTDIKSERLTKDVLSGALTQLASYRGTSCQVRASEYVIKRLKGIKTPEVEQALAAREAMRRAIVPLLRLLGPKDFELLVELVFGASGYRRVGVVGGVQKTIDLDLELPVTGERAFVQIKSKTSQAELARYVEQIEDHYDQMFFVFHTGAVTTDDARVRVIGPDDLARLVVDAGLSDWLIRKVS